MIKAIFRKRIVHYMPVLYKCAILSVAATGLILTGKAQATPIEVTDFSGVVVGEDELSGSLTVNVTGLATSDVTGLDTTLGDLGTDMTAAQSDIAALETDMTAAQSSISGLETDMTAAQSDISDLETIIGDVGAAISASDNFATATNVAEALTGLDTAVSQVASGIGGPVTGASGNISGLATMSANLDSLDTAIGNRGDLNGANGNLATGGSIVTNLNQIDASIGNLGAVNSKLTTINGASGNNIAQNFQAVGDAIGDVGQLVNTKYARGAEDLTTAIQYVDSALHDTNREMRAGFASTAALTALVPNARADNNTQLSMGTGVYRDRAGFALGAFHYVNDNVLLNAGVSYGGTKSVIGKAGVTFGW